MPGKRRHGAVPRATLAVFDTSRRAVKAWVAELPTGDLEVLGRHLLDVVQQVNGRATAVDELFHLLEAMGPVTAAVFAYLETRYAGQPWPMGHSASAAARLALELSAAMTRAYGAAFRSYGGNARWPWRVLRRGRRAVCLHRLFRYGARMTGIFRQLHRNTPAGTWRRFHWYWRVAEVEGMTDARLRRIDDEQCRTSVEHEYKRLLLLALFPAHVAPPLRAQMDATLDGWVARVALRRPDGREPCGQYALQLGADSGARPLAGMAASELEDADTRLVDTRRVVEQLEFSRYGVGKHGEAEAPTGATLSALIWACWCSAQGRREQRWAVQELAEVAIGFRAMVRRAGVPSGSIRSPSVLRGGVGAVPGWIGGTQSKEPGSELLPGRIVNKSEHGLSLVMPGGLDPQLAVGMPLAVRTRESGWRFGTLTRLKPAGGVIALGVRWSMTEAFSARLYTVSGGATGPEFDVVVGRMPAEPWVMVAPTLASLRAGTPVLEAGGNTIRVDLARVLVESPYQTVFQIRAEGGQPADFDAMVRASTVPREVSAATAFAERGTARTGPLREERIRELMEQVGLSRSDSESIVEIERAAV